MADYRAVEAVSNALVRLLGLSYRPSDFDNDLQFRVYAPVDFGQPMAAGVSVFLYRILPNGTYRTPAGRLAPNGGRYQTRLPLDLHYLMTIWARDASLQHRIAGWMMRILEDTPILPHGLLESVAPGVFEPDETAEIVIGELSNEDLLRIWETLGQNEYGLSVPYLVRSVRVESTRTISSYGPFQERVFDWTSSADASSPEPE